NLGRICFLERAAGALRHGLEPRGAKDRDSLAWWIDATAWGRCGRPRSGGYGAVRRLAALLMVLSLYAQTASPGLTAYEKANALFVAKEFPECLAQLETALQLDPKLVPALTFKAKLAMTIYRFDVARESLERALAADP